MSPRLEASTTVSMVPALTQSPNWINTSRKLTTADLSNRLLLVFFWTYSDSQSPSFLQDLIAIAKEFPNQVTPIAVHSAKFPAERNTEFIRTEVSKLDIPFPVLNDEDSRIARTFGLETVPTLALVNPNGTVLERYSGETTRERLSHEIRAFLAEIKTPQSQTPLPLSLEKILPRDVSFPGKIAYGSDETGNAGLFVSDSQHHRIAILTMAGKIFISVGQKDKPGFRDGAYSVAQFRNPQGLLVLDKKIFVADAGNHALREIDLRKKTVTTLAGMGERGSARLLHDAPALETPLNTPTELAFFPTENEIAIALPAIHQIWQYDRKRKVLNGLAGNGNEGLQEGVYPANELAQPTGLFTWRGKLYFVDAGSSSVRVLEEGKVRTLVGNAVQQFGMRDGARGDALLQHPSALIVDDAGLVIADSFNHALRHYSFRTSKLETWIGKGKAGQQNGPFSSATFNEPSGLVQVGNLIYVADTNNHRIRTVDVTNKTVETLPVANFVRRPLTEHLPNLIKSPSIQVPPELSLPIVFHFSKGWTFDAEAVSWMTLYKVTKNKTEFIQEFPQQALRLGQVHLPPLELGGTYRLQGSFSLCSSDRTPCKVLSRDQTIHVDDGAPSIKLEVAL